MSAHSFSRTRGPKSVKKYILSYLTGKIGTFFVRMVCAQVVKLELDFYASRHLFDLNHDFWDRSTRSILKFPVFVSTLAVR